MDQKPCARCGRRERLPGFAMCERCREQTRKYRERPTPEGMCNTCKLRPALPGRRNCEKCAEVKRMHSRKWRQQPVPEGMCSRCRSHEHDPGKKLCANCRANAYHRWRTLPEETRAEIVARNRAARWANPEYVRAYTREHNQKIKREAMDHYGGICACCGEAELAFLSLDHVNNDGCYHREKLFGPRRVGGQSFYKRLRMLGWPNDPPLQVLCFNCNHAKAHLGYCPHQRK